MTLLSREQLEAREAAFLAPYATLSTLSGGREYAEAESLRRTAFQRDRDRVLHTSAFRRLEHKTQVFLNVQGDHYRTRLTHTLEVQQVARSLALTLGLNETLAETVALAHDLGHPPFGHAGEKILDELLAPHGGFNHNLQAVRIVRMLEQRYADFPGLNLTRATLDGLNKHHREALIAQGKAQPSLEAQLVDAADALAYTAHDIDDGLRSGLLHPEQLLELELWRGLLERLPAGLNPRERRSRHMLHRELLGWLIGDLSQQSGQNIIASGVQTLAEVQARPARLVGYSEQMRGYLRQTRAFLFANLYEHWQVERQREQAQEVLTRLYTRFTAKPSLLPPQVHTLAEQVGLERAACDYIAGMTDRYALETYAALMPPTGGQSW